MTASGNKIKKGRDSFEKQEWADAYRQISEADRDIPLEPMDLERLSVAAYLVGKDDESTDSLSRAHHGYMKQGENERAIRCAIWLALILFNRGEAARGGGWVARAQRLLEEIKHECVEKAYLKIPLALKLMAKGDYKNAYSTFEKADTISGRFDDQDVITFAHLGQGQALILMGEIEKGVTFLDESMISVEAGEVSPIVAGIVYCAVIDACHKIFDMRRAKEWTAALSRWCESQPDMVPYRGQCLIRRAEIMLLQGSWDKAMEEFDQACEWLSEKRSEPAAGEAFYQQAELFRMQGEYTKAEEAYRTASKWGRKPQPGLAQLRLVQGQIDAAKASISREFDETKAQLARSRILPAYIEIMLASNNLQSAHSSAEELSQIAETIQAPYIKALADHMKGAVLLAEGNPGNALGSLEQALKTWKALEAPYEAAQVRVHIGLAYRELGDEDMAEVELEAAHWAFQELGAIPDVEKTDSFLKPEKPQDKHRLSPREIEVLSLISAGKTNKSIAGELYISERTVERHVSNIFNKLGVSSRSAATSYAFKHRLI